MSHSSSDCLSHMIGLSRTNCNCYDSDKPGDYNESDSGLYLDEQEGLRLNMVEAASDCEAGGIWDILTRARENAVTAFKADVMAALIESKLKPKRQPFTGNIGEAGFKTTLDVTAYSYAGVRIFCSNIISGVMKIKRIGLVFDAVGTFNVSVYNNYSTTPINTYSVTSVANGLNWFTLPTPLELDMNNEYESNPQYYILYAPSTTPNPKDIKGSCGCSSNHYRYYFDVKNPVFKSYEKYRWSEFIMLTGTKGTTLSDRENWGRDGYLNGIILDAEFNCKTSELICKQNLSYDSNPLALSMAYAVRYRAAAIVIDDILASGQINRYTMMDRETMSGKRNNFIAEYRNRVAWIAKEMNYKANDCLTCDDFDDVLRVGVFS
jgi:hypothetical protein